MSPFFSLLVLVVVAYAAEACPQKCDFGCLSAITGTGRKKREATDKVKNVLLEFDIKLTEDLANEIGGMNEGEKELFLKDLEKMNDAVNYEITSLKENTKGATTQDNLLQAIADKIAQDFRGQKWFNRLRSFAGEKIAKLMKEISDEK